MMDSILIDAIPALRAIKLRSTAININLLFVFPNMCFFCAIYRVTRSVNGAEHVYNNIFKIAGIRYQTIACAYAFSASN